MASCKTEVQTVGELLDWLQTNLADGSLRRDAPISCPDLYGSSRGGMIVMVTTGGIPSDPEPSLFQCWGPMQ